MITEGVVHLELHNETAGQTVPGQNTRVHTRIFNFLQPTVTFFLTLAYAQAHTARTRRYPVRDTRRVGECCLNMVADYVCGGMGMMLA